MTRAGILALAVAVTTCTVDRSGLDEDAFPCRTNADCIDGYGCQLVDARGDGTCAEIVTNEADCDGFVTAAGLCLDECVPGGQGCEGDESCVSNDVLRGGEGYCVLGDTCSVDADCPAEGDACLSTVIHEFVRALWGVYEFPQTSELTCVPQCPDGGDCPTGTECLSTIAPGLDYCLPRCGDDSACPLGFACYVTAGVSIGICIPGVSLMACQDDSNCLSGGCETLPDGAGAEIDLCAPRCDGESPPCTDATIVGDDLNIFQCTADPQSGDEFCIFRSGYLMPCRIGAAFDCVDGLECREIPLAEGGTTPACVRDCVFDPEAPNEDANADCAEGAFCYPGSLFIPGFPDACVYDLPDDSACVFDDQCASGACHLELAGTCSEQEDVGCCAP